MGGVDFAPHLDDREDLRGSQVGEGEVVLGGEGEDVAFPCYWFGAEEEGCEVAFLCFWVVLGLGFLDGAVVIHEYEGVFVVRVLIALGALILWAEVACRIVLGQGGL